MVTNKDSTLVFLPLKATATQLGVPARWLKAEAEAGRIPYLRAGRRILLIPDIVAAVLLERAATSSR